MVLFQNRHIFGSEFTKANIFTVKDRYTIEQYEKNITSNDRTKSDNA